nr:DNA recombination protein RmuC [Fusobacterium sp. IOR10]
MTKFKDALSEDLKTNFNSVLFLPEPVGTIAIDSKFPLENYKKMTDKLLSKTEKLDSEKAFKKDIKNHIDAIANKYIIPGETSNQAIMFLPAEVIFAELNAYHSDLIEYSQNKKVWICSPTTLMSVLSTMQVVLKNLEREKYSGIIYQELNRLGTEFNRYKVRWEALAKHIDNVTKDVKDIATTTNKI